MKDESASTGFDHNYYECFLNRYKAFIENHYSPQLLADRVRIEQSQARAVQ
jgi:hypothetical protein